MIMHVLCPASSGRLGRQRGVVLIMSMFVLLIMASFAVSMSVLSSSNLHVADNHHKANCALSIAESGMEIMRYLLDDITIAGAVEIVNPLASVDIKGGQASIGGDKGDDALDHVTIGVDSAQFPRPDPSVFEGYATNSFDSSITTTGGVLKNVRIPAGTNPKVSGHTGIQGVLYFEAGNVVEFMGSTDITGVVVCEGDVTDDSGTNQLIFRGNVDSASAGELPAGFVPEVKLVYDPNSYSEPMLLSLNLN